MIFLELPPPFQHPGGQNRFSPISLYFLFGLFSFDLIWVFLVCISLRFFSTMSLFFPAILWSRRATTRKALAFFDAFLPTQNRPTSCLKTQDFSNEIVFAISCNSGSFAILQNRLFRRQSSFFKIYVFAVVCNRSDIRIQQGVGQHTPGFNLWDSFFD